MKLYYLFCDTQSQSGTFLLSTWTGKGKEFLKSTEFKNDFKKVYGAKELDKFSKLFRDNFITEEDFKNIKKILSSPVANLSE